MRLTACLLTLAFAAPLAAQEKLRILPADSEPRSMLHQYLLKEAQKYFDARRQTVAKLKTPEQIHARQKELRANFLRALGGFPEKTPLNARIVGTLKGDGFRVEKVIYESRPEHHVTAALYLPDGKGPFPGVLLPCGHSTNGKAAEAYQRACILLAKNGMAVLCFDPIGQGERLQLLEKGVKPGIKGSTSEHTLIGIGALLVGQCAANYRIWDGIRSLDYLASRAEVDPKRLGCTGNSGGGTMTAYLMALDDRIACAAPSCYLTTLERLFATLGPQDAEQNIPGQVAFGMEHADYLTLRAPRPTLMAVASQDFFDIKGAWTTFREASLIYGKLGHGERVALFEFDDKHGFSRPRREAAMRWLRRWLVSVDDAPAEGKFPIFTDAQLQCTRSGQVLEDFRGRSAFHLNAQTARALAPTRAKFVQRPAQERTAEIRRLLGLPGDIPASNCVSETEGKEKGIKFKNVAVLEIEPGIHVASVQLSTRDTKRQVIYLTDRGIAADLRPDGPIRRLARDEGSVLALEVRGLGETAPAPPSAKPSYFGTTFKHAFLAMHLNRPLLGQRVRDVLAVLNSIEAQGAEFHMVGVGEAAPVALHVAALDPRVKRVTLESGIVSWENVVRTPISYGQLANVVPGVLKVYDLPELAATLAPRTLTIRNPVDAALRPLAQAELDAAYASCRAAYERSGAAKALHLETAK